MSKIHIPSLAPEVLFHIGPIAITNTLINAWLAIAIILVIGILISRSVKLRPGKMQNFAEYTLELIFPYFDQVTGDRRMTLKFFPLVGGIFFFVLLSNWLGLMPGTGSITYGESFLFRPAATDLNLTAAMAVVSVLFSHIVGIVTIGFFAHTGKFIQIKQLVKSLKKGPIAILTAIIEFFIGLLEIISEVAKVLSLSLRLFGNVFVGEVLLTVIAALFAVLLPTPFMLLEVLVGLIQATVFAMLTLVYLTVASAEPHGAEN